MAVVAVDVFEADVFEDAIFADFTSDYIDRLDLTNKVVFIKTDVTAFHPTDDMYPEVRTIRRIDESTRVVDMPVVAQGNVQAGANKTPRRVVLNNGWRIGIEYPASGTLSVLGEVISDDGQAGSQLVLLDYLPSGVSMLVNYTPADSEVIEVQTGSGVSAQDIIDISDQASQKTWNALTANHTTDGTFGKLVSKLLTVGKFLGLR